MILLAFLLFLDGQQLDATPASPWNLSVGVEDNGLMVWHSEPVGSQEDCARALAATVVHISTVQSPVRRRVSLQCWRSPDTA